MLAKSGAKGSVGLIAAVSNFDELVDWGAQPESLRGDSHSSGQLLYRTSDGQVESGLWVCTPGRWRLSLPGDELCHFIDGRATYYRDDGQITEVGPGSVVMFPAGWRGQCEVRETIRNAYMLSMNEAEAGQNTEAKLLNWPSSADKVVNWGPVPTMVEGSSHTSGVMLYRRSNGGSEAGIWQCTPGRWKCHVTSDEFCHFLEGHCTYIHESGEVIEIAPDTLAFFPEGWRGICHITETIRKIYMIR